MRIASRARRIDAPHPRRGDVDSQAREWLAYLYSGDATPDGERDFRAWLADSPEHAAAYARCERIWRDIGSIDVRIAGEAGESVQRRAAGRVERRKSAAYVLRWMGALAAALLVVSVGLWQMRPSPEPVTEERFVSGPGEIKTLKLADGSRITLSASSTLVTRLAERSRRVQLLAGRAYFDVAHDAARPFAVSAGATEIRVTGTQFDVLNAPHGVRIAVAEGIVNVSGAQSKTARLIAGESVESTTEGVLGAVGHFQAQIDLAWRKGRLVYVDVPLEEVLAEVNRFRERPIVLATPNLGALRVTASFRTDQTDQLLTALAATEPVTVERKADSVRLQSRTGTASDTERP
jgi:transmembrane sensor